MPIGFWVLTLVTAIGLFLWMHSDDEGNVSFDFRVWLPKFLKPKDGKRIEFGIVEIEMEPDDERRGK